MVGPDLQKEVRTIKTRTNPGSSRNFAAAAAHQHTKASLNLTAGVRTGLLLPCSQLPCHLNGRMMLHQPSAVEEL